MPAFDSVRPSVTQPMLQPHTEVAVRLSLRVALLTGGGDKPYALGLATALTGCGIIIDFVGSDHLVSDVLEHDPHVNFLNLRGNQDSHATLAKKAHRIACYYLRLLRFARTAKAPIFHILWNNRFETIDRVFFPFFYKLCGRRVVFTAHNVNASKRDRNDNWLNQLTLRIQYRLVDHIFVHTLKASEEMQTDFGVGPDKISVIPFGINNTIQATDLSRAQAKRLLGVRDAELTMLFFGQIAPYKGVEYLLKAFIELAREKTEYRLVIAGSPKWDGQYWRRMEEIIKASGLEGRIVQRIGFVPDEQTEVFFKAADVLILPYTDIFQSGVLSLAYSFGLPVVATDVGSLSEEIIENETGFICKARDANDLAAVIRHYFSSELYSQLETRRKIIREYANERFSWKKVAKATGEVYANLVTSLTQKRIEGTDDF
jgi:D-inositol-3-phosphate glycosyltransferase